MIAVLLASTVALPPDGTYTYAMEQGGTRVLTSQVVFARGPAGVEEREHSDIQGGISTARTFDSALRELDYSGRTPTAEIRITLVPGKATLTYQGASQEYALPAGAPALVLDGLFAPAAILPAFIAAHHAAAFTGFATLHPRTLDVEVDSDARPVRPAGVPAADSSLTLTIEGAKQTLWFDPATNVVDEFDPNGETRVRLVSRSADVSTFAPAPTPTPFVSPFRSRDVHFVSKDGSVLAGTLSFPDGPGPFAAVILLQGSGVSDRNETVGPNAVFAELANALNARGYAVLRYDKRGTGESSSTVPLANVVRNDPVQDGVAATRFVAAASQIDPKRIYFLGHSEGGEIVLGIALAGAPLRGVIMLSPLPLNYSAMIERQLVRNHAPPASVAQYRAQEKQAYIASFDGVDPVAEVREVTLPLLLVHGSKDANVTNEDIAPFIASAKAAHPLTFTDVELRDDDHLFARLPTGQASTGAEYFTQLTLDPRLIDALAGWLSTH